MSNQQENQARERFEYTYSAREQEELKKIRSKYLPREEDKMETLRRLDGQAAKKATAAALSVGIVGALLLGLGMSCTMVWAGQWFLPGIIIGVAGIALAALAYPLYRRTLRKQRQRIAPQILRLTEEMLK